MNMPLFHEKAKEPQINLQTYFVGVRYSIPVTRKFMRFATNCTNKS